MIMDQSVTEKYRRFCTAVELAESVAGGLRTFATSTEDTYTFMNVQRQTLAGFLDAIMTDVRVLPAVTAADIGKVLSVDNDGGGNPVVRYNFTPSWDAFGFDPTASANFPVARVGSYIRFEAFGGGARMAPVNIGQIIQDQFTSGSQPSTANVGRLVRLAGYSADGTGTRFDLIENEVPDAVLADVNRALAVVNNSGTAEYGARHMGGLTNIGYTDRINNQWEAANADSLVQFAHSDSDDDTSATVPALLTKPQLLEDFFIADPTPEQIADGDAVVLSSDATGLRLSRASFPTGGTALPALAVGNANMLVAVNTAGNDYVYKNVPSWSRISGYNAADDTFAAANAGQLTQFVASGDDSIPALLTKVQLLTDFFATAPTPEQIAAGDVLILNNDGGNLSLSRRAFPTPDGGTELPMLAVANANQVVAVNNAGDHYVYRDVQGWSYIDTYSAENDNFGAARENELVTFSTYTGGGTSVRPSTISRQALLIALFSPALTADLDNEIVRVNYNHSAGTISLNPISPSDLFDDITMDGDDFSTGTDGQVAVLATSGGSRVVDFVDQDTLSTGGGGAREAFFGFRMLVNRIQVVSGTGAFSNDDYITYVVAAEGTRWSLDDTTGRIVRTFPTA